MEIQADSFHRSRLPDVETDLLQCPNCAKQLKPYEVAKHCEEEVERLQRMQLLATETITSNEQRSAETTDTTAERRKPWTVYQKVQRNRHTRLRHSRKRPVSAPLERACPVCNRKFPQEEIEFHVDECLRRSKGTNDDNEQSSSDEYEEEYEEYEWAGQKRIRASTMLEGGYAAFGIGQAINRNGNGRQNASQSDEDEDLNVDEDDTHIYGPPQYGESDIIPVISESAGNNSEEANVTNYMRKLIDNADGTERSDDAKSPKNNGDVLETASTSNGVCSADVAVKGEKTCVYEQIIDSLKAKLRQYETQQQSKFKCLICLDEYKKPTISVSCWHVHCEDCWLRSLGARKLCPQCNLITTPKDLRRIYM